MWLHDPRQSAHLFPVRMNFYCCYTVDVPLSFVSFYSCNASSDLFNHKVSVLPCRYINAIQDSESERAKTRNTTMKIAVVCDVKPCSVVVRHQCYLHLQSRRIVLMVDASSLSSNTLARIDQNT
jgi:hypothetical protein